MRLSNAVFPFLSLAAGLAAAALLGSTPDPAAAQCNPAEMQTQYYTAVNGVCPCFIPGEEAGVTFNIPPGDFPVEVLRVGIGWFSQFGGAPQQIEEGIHVYEGGLPNPGARLYTLPGPVMTDGFINEFDLEAQLGGNLAVNTGPVTVTIEFLNQSSGNLFAPSVAYDNGCTAGKNLIKANPGGWQSACTAGVPGDWVFYLVYKRICQSGVGDEITVTSVPVSLMDPRPNPFYDRTEIEFVLGAPGEAHLSVFDIQGRLVAHLADEAYGAGRHSVAWDGRADGGSYLTPGLYFLRLESGGRESVRKIVLGE